MVDDDASSDYVITDKIAQSSEQIDMIDELPGAYPEEYPRYATPTILRPAKTEPARQASLQVHQRSVTSPADGYPRNKDARCKSYIYCSIPCKTLLGFKPTTMAC
ncbi:hypothetical protein F442_20385 [Phytophthora nicotianae P10297]|uniref:Uncharacterized protein n=4 Tax=Phytophthora nicotianae TaxID=4792 RepID=W2QUG0_PHYN3|nr:hypothetical protein PPTG_21773 [Phytophthora nicotianae INRA-310]ETI32666.1 hypothetical protein F443_20573 [Phytophthora nicotianae P1569]ETN16743.1 hypothetical protein PPTG_21773 [Phytophthora nicotianae INRA-310]ETO61400.1 hypothetical protein F444_20587 [Phytophthora nicotianae P1976]ETP30667.1 hypothetical protein F442_20385 [Phytophthora nicotianae P10297]